MRPFGITGYILTALLLRVILGTVAINRIKTRFLSPDKDLSVILPIAGL